MMTQLQTQADRLTVLKSKQANKSNRPEAGSQTRTQAAAGFMGQI